MADAPKRIQLSRRKGYRKPECAIVVSRPSRWGNRHRLDEAGFRAYLAEHPELVAEARLVLRGHDLGCWCALDAPWCHADTWIELANA